VVSDYRRLLTAHSTDHQRRPNWRFATAVGYLNTFIDFERLPEPRLQTEASDIDRFRGLLKQLGNPQQQYKIIHVVGTKGKGSTSALIASCLQRAGYKVGLYTSPHLITVRERIEINGRPISRTRFAHIMATIKDSFEASQREKSLAFRTVFELLTAAGFVAFAEEGVEIAVVEAGLGAKLDATIVVDPLLTVVTPIGLDHTTVLGNTVTLIASDKAHAIKSMGRAISAPQSTEAKIELEARAEKMGAALRFAPGAIEFQIKHEDLNGSKVIGLNEPYQGMAFTLPLAGGFQLTNLSTALGAITWLRELGINVSDSAIKSGVAHVRWPGRFQTVAEKPPIILDGAHNTIAIRALVEAVELLLPAREMVVVFSAIHGKPVVEMLREIGQFANHIIVAPLRFPKGYSTEELLEAAETAGVRVEAASGIPQAIELAKTALPESGALLITGSLYLIGEALRHLKGLPPPANNGGIDPAI